MTTPVVVVEPEIAKLRLDDLVPDPRQPRKTFDPDALAQLAASIKSLGIIEPLVVRPVVNAQDGKPAGTPVAHYVIIAGERRWRAARKAGLAAVPAVIRRNDGEQTHLLQLAENMEREALRPLEVAESYHRWLQPSANPVTHVDAAGKMTTKPQYKRTQAELAKALGKTEAHVSQMLALRELPAPGKKLLDDGVLTFAHGRALLPLLAYPSALNAIVQEVRQRAQWGAVFTVRELGDRVGRELTRVKERERKRREASKAKKKGKGAPKRESFNARWEREQAERRRRDELEAARWKAGLTVQAPRLRQAFAADAVHRLVRKVPGAFLAAIARGLRLPEWGHDADVARALQLGTAPARRVAGWLWLRRRLGSAKQQIATAGAAAVKAASKKAPARKGGRK
jgi:ParB family chromosome partitioning protein